VSRACPDLWEPRGSNPLGRPDSVVAAVGSDLRLCGAVAARRRGALFQLVQAALVGVKKHLAVGVDMSTPIVATSSFSNAEPEPRARFPGRWGDQSSYEQTSSHMERARTEANRVGCLVGPRVHECSAAGSPRIGCEVNSRHWPRGCTI
jgi:hypothetical protein